MGASWINGRRQDEQHVGFVQTVRDGPRRMSIMRPKTRRPGAILPAERATPCALRPRRLRPSAPRDRAAHPPEVSAARVARRRRERGTEGPARATPGAV
jgi:hypothetical protein